MYMKVGNDGAITFPSAASFTVACDITANGNIVGDGATQIKDMALISGSLTSTGSFGSINFDNELAKVIPATYIEFTQNPELFTHETSPNKSWATAISRGWTVFSLKSSHNAQRSNPHKLADLLERAVK